MPVALGTFLQTGDDDLSTHEAGAASGTGRNVQLGSKIVLHKVTFKNVPLLSKFLIKTYLI